MDLMETLGYIASIWWLGMKLVAATFLVLCAFFAIEKGYLASGITAITFVVFMVGFVAHSCSG